MTSEEKTSPQSLYMICENIRLFRLSSSVCPLESAVYFNRLINFSGLFGSCLCMSVSSIVCKKKRRREGINQIWVSNKSGDKQRAKKNNSGNKSRPAHPAKGSFQEEPFQGSPVWVAGSGGGVLRWDVPPGGLLCLWPLDSSPFHSRPNKDSETVQHCRAQ